MSDASWLSSAARKYGPYDEEGAHSPACYYVTRRYKADSQRAEGALILRDELLGPIQFTFNEGHYQAAKRMIGADRGWQVRSGDTKAAVVARALKKSREMQVERKTLQAQTTLPSGKPFLHFTTDGDYLFLEVTTLRSERLCPVGKSKVIDEKFLISQPLTAVEMDGLLDEQAVHLFLSPEQFSTVGDAEKLTAICDHLNHHLDRLDVSALAPTRARVDESVRRA